MSTKNELLGLLHAQNVFALGEYVLKSGVISPIYIDLRILVSSTDTLRKAALAMANCVTDCGLKFDYVVGVPFGAITLAFVIAETLGLPMLLKRPEAKSHGKKRLIEGIYEPGRRALVVEDVVTSGASIEETVLVMAMRNHNQNFIKIKELRKAGLVCEDVICFLNREQGGVAYLKSKGINLLNVLTMSDVLNYLVEQHVITHERMSEIQQELRSPRKAINNKLNDAMEVVSVPRCGLVCEEHQNSWSFAARLPLMQNPLNKTLIEISLKKSTNLCLALDLHDKDQILQTIEKVKEHICVLKLHYDIVDGFDAKFAKKLTELAKEHEFLIFEDRKFGDIGEIMQQQVKNATWADLVTIHAIQGSPSVKALTSVVEDPSYKLQGVLLLAQMSANGSLTDEKYIREAVQIGEDNQNVVCGFICQKRCHYDRRFLYWTPGVHLSKNSEGTQCWRSIEQAILEDGCDIVIVGRGITQAEDVAAEAKMYAENAWKALTSRR